jgi:hypothetical protein
MAFAALGFALCIATACNKSRAHFAKELKQQRLAWNMKTLVDAYHQAGFTDPRWDAFAEAALTEFAQARADVTPTNEPWADIISTNVAAAVEAGCTDPMVNYLYIKFAMDQSNTKEAFADAFIKVAKALNTSSYPAIRKFYAAARAMEQIHYTYGTNSANQPDSAEISSMIGFNLIFAVSDKAAPATEAYEAADLAQSLGGAGLTIYERNYGLVEKPMFENWPDAATTWLWKGQSYIKMAWLGRGGGYADKVTPEGWKVFHDDLTVAESALKKAWKLDPTDKRIPMEMIRVDEGLQKNRTDMELWFNRAMTIDPDCYQACEYKLHYLYPQWYGSREDMLAFGRECVANPNWRGNVPLILVAAHVEYQRFLDDPEARSNYWTVPDVWPDIKAAYDRFFELNPDAIGYYQNYTWYAYHAEQWDALNELIPKLGPVNYDFFGGKEEFDKMVQLAREHTGNSK